MGPKYIPLSGQIKLGTTLFVLLVDLFFLTTVDGGSWLAGLLVDADVLSLFFVARTGSGSGSLANGERFLLSIFPSGARRLSKLDLSLYSGLSSLRDSVTPVRRREDTEGDGDAGVKVQIDWLVSVLSRMPFEMRAIRKEDKKRLEGLCSCDGSEVKVARKRRRVQQRLSSDLRDDDDDDDDADRNAGEQCACWR